MVGGLEGAFVNVFGCVRWASAEEDAHILHVVLGVLFLHVVTDRQKKEVFRSMGVSTSAGKFPPSKTGSPWSHRGAWASVGD